MLDIVHCDHVINYDKFLSLYCNNNLLLNTREIDSTRYVVTTVIAIINSLKLLLFYPYLL